MNSHEELALSVPGHAVSAWEPESPFLPDPVAAGRPALSAAIAFGPPSEIESPFTSEYALEGEAIPGPQAEQFARFSGDIYEVEFDAAVTDLVNEAAALAEDRFSRETGDISRDRANAESALREYLAPLERESDALLDRMIAGLAGTDVAPMTEAEIEGFMDRYEPAEASASPVFENFLKKLWKKAKKVVKTVAKVAGKLNPITLALGKLKALVRPLLERVLRFAIRKLPQRIQPVARQLAKKFLGISVEPAKSPVAKDSDPGGQATADPSDIQEEMDSRLAAYVLGGEEAQRDAEVQEFAEAQGEQPEDPLGELDAAREQFARNIIALPITREQIEAAERSETERERLVRQVAPVVEQFIPAVLAAARIAIGLIGRPRVVDFLAGMVANLIYKYVGAQAATALSRALVDTGLRLVSLESTPEAEQLAAGYTIASTVEDTVNRLLTDAPAEAWESEELMGPYAYQAFEGAAAASFPDGSIRPELRETAEQPGAWVLLPTRRRRKRFKKYTRVIEVSITPQMAQAIPTFGGGKLSSVLRDRYGTASDAVVRARVHLYEAIRGTTLSLIAWHEKSVPGLGHAGPSAWTLIHPLTTAAAGILFQEPGLGADVPARFLVDRNLIEVGQRFFFIEVPDAKPRALPAPSGRSSASADGMSQTRLALDFPRGQIRLFMYYAETDAQKLASALEKRASAEIIARALSAGLEVNLRAILAGGPDKRLRVIHEAVPTQEMLPAAFGQVLKIAGTELVKILVRWAIEAIRAELAKAYDAFADAFRKAAADKADGVTLILIFDGPSFFDKLRKSIPGGLGAIPGLGALFAVKAVASSVTAQIRPGFHVW